MSQRANLPIYGLATTLGLPSHGMAKAPECRSQPVPCSLVPVDPFRHQPLVAEALVRNSAPFDPGEFLREGDLLGCGQLVHVGYGLQPGLSLDPGAQRSPVLLNFPGQERPVAQGERPRIGDLLRRYGQGVRGAFHDETPFWLGSENRTKQEQNQAKRREHLGARGREGPGKIRSEAARERVSGPDPVLHSGVSR